MLTDYHIHVEQGPYSVAWLRKFQKQAAAKHIGDWGISEHAYRFVETKHIFYNDWVAARQKQRIDEYLEMIYQAREQGINVKLGIEIDYFPEREEEISRFIEQYPFDYVIGSVHWINDWGIDLSEMKEQWDVKDVNQVWQDYFDRIDSLAKSKLFDIAAHLDLVKIFKYIPSDQGFIQEQYQRVAESLAHSNTCIEISTAGLRKMIGEIYPHPTLLKTCHQNRVPIVISSDAHCPEDVGANFDQAVTLAKGVGYTEVQVFTARKPQPHPLG